jgi:hypothetical protein
MPGEFAKLGAIDVDNPVADSHGFSSDEDYHACPGDGYRPYPQSRS